MSKADLCGSCRDLRRARDGGHYCLALSTHAHTPRQLTPERVLALLPEITRAVALNPVRRSPEDLACLHHRTS